MHARTMPALLALAASLIGPAAALAWPAPRAVPWAAASYDSSRRIDLNSIDMRVRNDGLIAFDVEHGSADLIFPKSSGKAALFAAGPWLAAKVNGEWRGALVQFASELGPGAMAGGTFTDPALPAYRTYKLRRSQGQAADTAHLEIANPAPGQDPRVHDSWSEYLAGAAPYGAPVRSYRMPQTSTPDPSDSIDVLGPDVEGDQMLWSVANDADPARHRIGGGGTAPLGVEIQQTWFALARPGALDRAVFLKLRIANLGGNTLDSLWLGLWGDPDVGGAEDDRIASDSARALVFAYNGHFEDDVYGATPPAIGFSLLRGLTDAGTVLGPYALTGPLKAQEPQTFIESVHLLQGLRSDGTPRLDPDGNPRRFWFTGDPVRGTGWTDDLLADRRMMLSTGPITMAAGDTQEVVIAIVLGQGEDNLSSVANLRCTVDQVRAAYASGFAAPAEPDCPTFALQSCPGSVAFWTRQCLGAGLSPADLARVIQCVDQSSTVFAFTPGMEQAQFCGVLTSPMTDPMSEAYRQQVAFLASVCATRLGLMAGADTVSLGDAIELWSPTVGARNVGEMAARYVTSPCHCADSLLVALSAFPPDSPPAQQLYRAITGELTALNHGLGLGPSCNREAAQFPHLIDATAATVYATLRWWPGAASGIGYAVDREESGNWVPRRQGIPARDTVIFVDGPLVGGRSYHYRLRINPGGREQVFADPVVGVPEPYVYGALEVRPNPAPGALQIRFGLPSPGPVTIEVFDLGGRRRERRRLTNLAGGEQQFTVGGGLEAGIYVVRLEQGDRSETAKAVIVR